MQALALAVRDRVAVVRDELDERLRLRVDRLSQPCSLLLAARARVVQPRDGSMPPPASEPDSRKYASERLFFVTSFVSALNAARGRARARAAQSRGRGPRARRAQQRDERAEQLGLARKRVAKRGEDVDVRGRVRATTRRLGAERVAHRARANAAAPARGRAAAMAAPATRGRAAFACAGAPPPAAAAGTARGTAARRVRAAARGAGAGPALSAT